MLYLENYWRKILSRNKNNFLKEIVFEFLLLLSYLYSFIWEVYLLLYKLKILKQKKISAFVISFGNLTLGGGGKTQFVIKFLQCLAKDKKAAVLLRGYKSKIKKEILVVSDGEKILADNTVSDEALLIAEKNKNIVVITGKDRLKTSFVAMQKYKREIIILDDGYQYQKLYKDINIILIDTSVLWDNYRIFPAGILRERFKNIKRCDLVILNKINFADDNNIAILKKEIHKIKPDVMIIESEYKSTSLKELNSNNIFSLDTINNKKIVGVCGIANPKIFESMLLKLNPERLRSYFYPDHYFYTVHDVEKICKEMKENKDEMIITTEKDAVKLKNIKIEFPVFALILEIEIVKNKEIWDRICRLNLTEIFH